MWEWALFIDDFSETGLNVCALLFDLKNGFISKSLFKSMVVQHCLLSRKVEIGGFCFGEILVVRR